MASLSPGPAAEAPPRVDPAAFLTATAGGTIEWALFLGSGLSSVASLLGLADVASFDEVGLPTPAVPGHAGRLHVGKMSGRTLVAFAGRVHLYEGHDMEAVTRAVRAAASAGAARALIANAAGGLAPGLAVGDFMLIRDHVSLPGLCGYPRRAGVQLWPQFADQDHVYDAGMTAAATRAAAEIGQPVHEGVYAMVAGPQYETPAERSLLQRLGADAVGMSTAPEALAAHACGMRVLAISVITNTAAQMAPPTHEEVARVSSSASASLAAIVRYLVATGA